MPFGFVFGVACHEEPLTFSPPVESPYDLAPAAQTELALETMPSALSVLEGTTETLLVRLRHRPASSIAIDVDVDAPAAELAVPSSVVFTPDNYDAWQPLTVTALATKSDQDVTRNLTFTTVGPRLLATVPVEIRNTTVFADLGWPEYFGEGSAWSPGIAVCYPLLVTTATQLDGFGVVTGAAGAQAKMALYTDRDGRPDALVAANESSSELMAGRNFFDTTDETLPPGAYWIALRLSSTASIGSDLGSNETSCTKSLPNFGGSWPAVFGTSSCNSTRRMNLFARTFSP